MTEPHLFPIPFPFFTSVLATSEFLYKIIRKKDFFFNFMAYIETVSPKKSICFPSFQYKAD